MEHRKTWEYVGADEGMWFIRTQGDRTLSGHATPREQRDGNEK